MTLHENCLVPHPPISVITWVNNLPLYNGLVKTLLSRRGESLYGPPNVEFIAILPEDGARNMGEAYNMGRARASHKIKAYLHQDLAITDEAWDFKIQAGLAVPSVGAVGFIGCRAAIGPLPIWSPPEYWAGARTDPYRYKPEFQEVWLLDGMGLVTEQDFEWAECYEAQHYAVEDYCMQIKQAGLSVFTVPVEVKHLCAGVLGEDFWRSAELFRKRWSHFLPTAFGAISLDKWGAIFDSPEIRDGQLSFMPKREAERTNWLAVIEQTYPSRPTSPQI